VKPSDSCTVRRAIYTINNVLFSVHCWVELVRYGVRSVRYVFELSGYRVSVSESERETCERACMVVVDTGATVVRRPSSR